MTTKTIGAEHKSLYVSPLAEEIVVSSEECILSGGGSGSAGTTKPYMMDPVTGQGGGAGSGDLDGGSTGLL